MINVAVVGLGGIGNRHARCYQENPHTKVVAVCDLIQERADKAAAEHECPAFYSIKDMLAAGLTIDAASVCTAGEENGGDHFQPTMELLDAGVPVLGEKPISNRIAQGHTNGGQGEREAITLRHQSQPSLYARGRTSAAPGSMKAAWATLNFINMFMWISNPNESSPHFHMRRVASAFH